MRSLDDQQLLRPASFCLTSGPWRLLSWTFATLIDQLHYLVKGGAQIQACS